MKKGGEKTSSAQITALTYNLYEDILNKATYECVFVPVLAANLSPCCMTNAFGYLCHLMYLIQRDRPCLQGIYIAPDIITSTIWTYIFK